MKVLGLNNREYNINLSNYSKTTARKSSHHLKARELLTSMFKGYNIYEEVKLPGTVDPAKKSALFIDFLIPNARLGIEVHGKQHFEFIPYFHKTKAGFLQSKARDLRKEEWCELNEIQLIVFRFDETVEQWRNIINERC